MKISSKVRNGLAAMIYIAKFSDLDKKISLLNISKNLNISKIYLEQAFVLLKKENLVTSTKGPKGGYTLSKNPKEISIYEILYALDGSIFEKTEATINDSDSCLEKTMQSEIFSKIDECMYETLSNISLDYVSNKLKNCECEEYMYYL